jgi:archaellum component FlaC
MPFVFTWNVPNKQMEISCVANDIGEAQRQAIDIIQKLEDTSHEIKFLSEQRKQLIVQLHSATEESAAQVSTFSPLTKEEIRRKIAYLNENIESIRSRIDANIYLGLTSLADLKYTPGGDEEMSLVHVIIKTEPTVNPFYPITIKRSGGF